MSFRHSNDYAKTMTSIARAKQINEKKKIKNKKPMKAGRWANDERFAKN